MLRAYLQGSGSTGRGAPEATQTHEGGFGGSDTIRRELFFLEAARQFRERLRDNRRGPRHCELKRSDFRRTGRVRVGRVL